MELRYGSVLSDVESNDEDDDTPSDTFFDGSGDTGFVVIDHFETVIWLDMAARSLLDDEYPDMVLAANIKVEEEAFDNESVLLVGRIDNGTVAALASVLCPRNPEHGEERLDKVGCPNELSDEKERIVEVSCTEW